MRLEGQQYSKQGEMDSKGMSHQSLYSLNKDRKGAVLRGIAIISIILHNYCHWLGPIVKENEYTFKQHNVSWLNQVLLHPDSNLPLHIISFFGHYGVPIFLFLSAYGLVRKYETSASSSSLSGWIALHFLKLFRMLSVGFIAFIIVDYVTPGSWHYDWLKITSQLFMFNNVLPNPDRMIWPGPYWFFGLMMQFYLLYRLMLYRRHYAVTVVLMVICVGVQLMLEPDGEAINRYRYNFMGGMLPFGLGLLYARFDEPTLIGNPTRAKFFAGTLLCIVLCYALSQSFVSWTFVPVTVCLGGIWFVQLLSKVAWLNILFRLFAWLGSISAALFVVHPITRKLIIPISRHGETYTGLVLYIIASIALAWIFSKLIKRIPIPKIQH